MEYVFGTKKNMEVLKTKGSVHSCLTGFHTLESKYPDQTITDSFRIVRLIESKEDSEGNCYDWYEIDHHFRYTDKFTPAKDELTEGIGDNSDGLFDVASLADENSSCIEELAGMLSEMEERLAALEE